MDKFNILPQNNPLIAKDGAIVVNDCTLGHLAMVNKVDKKTLAKWLIPYEAEINKAPNLKYFTVKQV